MSQRITRPEEHDTDRAGKRLFRDIIEPLGWVVNETKDDYGHDFWVQEFENRNPSGFCFLVQLKSSASSEYSSERDFVSQSLESRHVEHYVHDMRVPTVIAHADTTAKRLFWYLPQLDAGIGHRIAISKQASYTIRIPTANELPATSRQLSQAIREVFRKLGEREAAAFVASGEMPQSPLELLGQYLRQLSVRDDRLRFELVLSENSGPPRSVGQVFSLRQGAFTINAFEAAPGKLQQRPITGRIRLTGEAISKFLESVRTGKETELDFARFESSLGHLFPELESVSGGKLKIGIPEGIRQRRVRLRVTFGEGPEAVVYPALDFAPLRAGTEEGEIATTESGLPFHISMIVRIRTRPAIAEVNFSYEVVGKRLLDVEKWFSALDLLSRGDPVEFFGIDIDKVVARSEAVRGNDGFFPHEALRALVRDAAAVAGALGINPIVSERVEPDELDYLAFLKDGVLGKSPEVTVHSLSIGVYKSAAENFLNSLTSANYKIEADRIPGSELKLFGTPIHPGPYMMEFTGLQLLNEKAFRQALASAADDEVIDAEVVPISDTRVTFMRFQAVTAAAV